MKPYIQIQPNESLREQGHQEAIDALRAAPPSRYLLIVPEPTETGEAGARIYAVGSVDWLVVAHKAFVDAITLAAIEVTFPEVDEEAA